jgi:hypothetical protein
MRISGIPDDHIERIHWYFGPGKGSQYAYRHIPSGILVVGSCPSQMPVHQFDQQLFAELIKKLKAAGVVKDEGLGAE